MFDGRESVITTASANSTIALSWDTSSTLSSMRRQARMSYFSSITPRSNNSIIEDELSERASLLTLSDLPSTASLTSNRIASYDSSALQGFAFEVDGILA